MSRPRKQRPGKGDPIAPGMSQRDIAATGVLSRRQIQTALAVGSIPKEQFEALVESDNPPTVNQLARIGRGQQKVARRRARKTCPHCGSDLR
jgi:hypothetical protein